MTNCFPFLLCRGPVCAPSHSAPSMSCPSHPHIPVLHCRIPLFLLLASCVAVSLSLHPRILLPTSPPRCPFHPSLYWPCQCPGHCARLSTRKPFFYLLFRLCLLPFPTRLRCPFPSCHVPIPTHTHCVKPPFTAPPLRTPSSYSSSPPALICTRVPPLLYALG